MKGLSSASPVLTCQQALELESSMLQDESAQWAAVQRAGVSVANAIYLDFQELQPLPEKFRTLALIGK